MESAGVVRCSRSQFYIIYSLNKEIFDKTLSEIIRKEHRLTQEEFGDIFGVSAQAVSKWERVECYPDITFLPDIAAALGCVIDDFFIN